MRYTREEVRGKVDWEGGLPDGLEWFRADQVPEEIENDWYRARQAWMELDDLLYEINAYLYREDEE